MFLSTDDDTQRESDWYEIEQVNKLNQLDILSIDISQDVNNTGPEALPVSVCNCFLLFDSVLHVLLVVFYPSFYVVLKNWNRSASGPVFTSCEMVYIRRLLVDTLKGTFCTSASYGLCALILSFWVRLPTPVPLFFFFFFLTDLHDSRIGHIFRSENPEFRINPEKSNPW